MKRVVFFLMVTVVSLWSIMTVFSQTVVLGPILVTIAVCSFIYSLATLYKIKPKWGRNVIAFFANLLTLPFDFH